MVFATNGARKIGCIWAKKFQDSNKEHWSIAHTVKQINTKWTIGRRNTKYIKLWEKILEKNLCDTGLDKNPRYDTNSLSVKRRKRKLEFINFKTSALWKTLLREWNHKSPNWKKYFQMIYVIRGSIQTLYLINKKKNSTEYWAKFWGRSFTNEDYPKIVGN